MVVCLGERALELSRVCSQKQLESRVGPNHYNGRTVSPLSRRAKWITGAKLIVDGGYTA